MFNFNVLHKLPAALQQLSGILAVQQLVSTLPGAPAVHGVVVVVVSCAVAAQQLPQHRRQSCGVEGRAHAWALDTEQLKPGEEVDSITHPTPPPPSHSPWRRRLRLRSVVAAANEAMIVMETLIVPKSGTVML